MSLESARMFIRKIEEDRSLTEKYKALLLESKDLSQDDILAKAAAFAADYGFEVTPEDFEAVAAESQGAELSDEELQAVAGGAHVEAALVFVGGGKYISQICIIIGIAW